MTPLHPASSRLRNVAGLLLILLSLEAHAAGTKEHRPRVFVLASVPEDLAAAGRALPAQVTTELLRRSTELDVIPNEETLRAVLPEHETPAACLQYTSCVAAVSQRLHADLYLTAVLAHRGQSYVLTVTRGSAGGKQLPVQADETMRLLSNVALNVRLCLGRLFPAEEAPSVIIPLPTGSADARAGAVTQGSQQPLSPEVRLSEILITRDSGSDAADRAHQAKLLLDTGVAFEIVSRAAKNALVSPTGDVGWVKQSELIPEIDRAVAKLPVGATSDVIETETSFRIVRVIDRRGGPANDVLAQGQGKPPETPDFSLPPLPGPAEPAEGSSTPARGEAASGGTEAEARQLDDRSRAAAIAGKWALAARLAKQALDLSYNLDRVLNLGKVYDSLCDVDLARAQFQAYFDKACNTKETENDEDCQDAKSRLVHIGRRIDQCRERRLATRSSDTAPDSETGQETPGGLWVAGQPIGALVTAAGPAGFSSKAGLPWRTSGLQPGTYHLRVTQDAYRTWEQDVTVSPAQTTKVHVTLRSRSEWADDKPDTTPAPQEFLSDADGDEEKLIAVGLTWQRWSRDGHTWEQASRYCAGLTGGWRLPAKDDLLDLYLAKSKSPEIAGDTHTYWSSTTEPPREAWYFNYRSGYPGIVGTDSRYSVRCVRGTSQPRSFVASIPHPARTRVDTPDPGPPAGWFQSPPFQRAIDVMAGTVFPDTFQFCLQVDPIWWLSIETCLGTVFVITSAHIDFRFPVVHYVENTSLLSWFHGWEFGFGPLLGVRTLDVAPQIEAFGSNAFDVVDVGLTFQAVYWYQPGSGLLYQVDLGAMVPIGGVGQPSVPYVEFKLGKAF